MQRRYSVPWSFQCLLSPGLLTHSAAAHIFPGTPFAADVSAEVLLVALHIPHQNQLQIGLVFLTVLLLNPQTVPLCSSSTSPSFFLLQASLLHLSFARSSLFIHAGLLPLLLDFLLTGMDPSWKVTHFSVSFTIQHTYILFYFGGPSLL